MSTTEQLISASVSSSARAARLWQALLCLMKTHLTDLDQVDRTSAPKAVDSGSIPGQVKPKFIKIGIYSVHG